MNIIYKTDYFNIIELRIEKRKTPIYKIYDLNDIEIGEIKWYAPWRKFCFYPDNSIWDTKCLEELLTALNIISLRWIVEKESIKLEKEKINGENKN